MSRAADSQRCKCWGTDADGRLVYKNQDDLPSSESSATCREITYQKAWPHKAKAGFQPTVKNVRVVDISLLRSTSASADASSRKQDSCCKQHPSLQMAYGVRSASTEWKAGKRTTILGELFLGPRSS